MNPDLREQLLEAIYDLKNCELSEASAHQIRLDKLLEQARAGTAFSRAQVYIYLRKTFYPDYAKRRRLRDRPKL